MTIKKKRSMYIVNQIVVNHLSMSYMEVTVDIMLPSKYRTWTSYEVIP